jgi:hypothetical protein
MHADWGNILLLVALGQYGEISKTGFGSLDGAAS